MNATEKLQLSPYDFLNPPIVSNRAPTTRDKSPQGSTGLGQIWVNKLTNTVYILTSVANNAAVWTVLGGLGVAGAVMLINPGNITATAGDIIATAGNITAGATVTAGTSMTAATNITATAGHITAGTYVSAGSYLAAATYITAGTTIVAGTNITSTAGNIAASAGHITASTYISAGSYLAAATTVTGGTGVVATTGNVVATAGAVNAGTSMTATLGNITATNGNFVATAADTGLQLGAAGPVVVCGTGAPGALAHPQGSLYLNLTGNSTATRLYVCSGAGTWVAVTTAS